MEHFSIFFLISLNTMNLFSIIIGIIIGLSTGAFNRYRTWWIVVLYFGCVSLWYAIKSGALKQWGIG